MDIISKETNQNISAISEKKEPVLPIPKLVNPAGKFSLGQTMSALGQKTSVSKLPFVLVSFVLVFVLAASAGLWFYKNSINQKIESVGQQSQDLIVQQNKEDEAKVNDLGQTLKSVKEILNKHIYASQTVDFLEKTTLPLVRWTGFNRNVNNVSVSLHGQTKDYNTLAKQILVFENDSQIKEVQASDISLSQLGGVNFSMALTFDPKIFNK